MKRRRRSGWRKSTMPTWGVRRWFFVWYIFKVCKIWFYSAALRKLEAKRKSADGKRERLDIVTEFQRYLLTDSRTKSGSQKSLTNKGMNINVTTKATFLLIIFVFCTGVHVHGELHQSVPKPGVKIHKVVDLNPTRVGKAVDLLMKYKVKFIIC